MCITMLDYSHHLAISVAIWTLLVCVVTSAPDPGCDLQIPGLPVAQSTPAPYSLSLSTQTYKPGNDGLAFTLEATGGSDITGFYIRVQRMSSDKVEGLIHAVSVDLRSVYCNDTDQSLGDVNVLDLTLRKVNFIWRYFEDSTEVWDKQVRIMVTVFSSPTEYWTDITSETIAIQQGDSLADAICLAVADTSVCYAPLLQEFGDFARNTYAYCPYREPIIQCLDEVAQETEAAGCPAPADDVRNALDICDKVQECVDYITSCTEDRDAVTPDSVGADEYCRHRMDYFDCFLNLPSSVPCPTSYPPYIAMREVHRKLQLYETYTCARDISCSSTQITSCVTDEGSLTAFNTDNDTDIVKMEFTANVCKSFDEAFSCIDKLPNSCRSWLPSDRLEENKEYMSDVCADDKTSGAGVVFVEAASLIMCILISANLLTE